MHMHHSIRDGDVQGRYPVFWMAQTFSLNKLPFIITLSTNSSTYPWCSSVPSRLKTRNPSDFPKTSFLSKFSALNCNVISSWNKTNTSLSHKLLQQQSTYQKVCFHKCIITRIDYKISLVTESFHICQTVWYKRRSSSWSIRVDSTTNLLL